MDARGGRRRRGLSPGRPGASVVTSGEGCQRSRQCWERLTQLSEKEEILVTKGDGRCIESVDCSPESVGLDGGEYRRQRCELGVDVGRELDTGWPGRPDVHAPHLTVLSEEHAPYLRLV